MGRGVLRLVAFGAYFLLHSASFRPKIRRMEAAMHLCGPISKNLLLLTAFALLVPGAFAQAQASYDAATEAKVKGIVEQLKLDPPTGGKAVAYLVIKNGEDKVQIFLCPKTFLDEMGATFAPGDSVQVTGSKVKQGGADVILAREITKSGDTVTLRFTDGKPAW